MNPPDATADEPSLATHLTRWFGQATQIVTGIAGFSYAFGWILAARFFSAFDLSPEDAGVTFAWLAIRAFLAGLSGLLVVVVVRYLLQTARRGKPVVLIVQSRWAIAGLTVLCCLAPAGLVVGVLAAWAASHDSTVAAASVVTVLACCVLIALLMQWLRPPTFQLGWNSSLLLRVLAGALLGFVLTALALLPFRLGDHLAAEVKRGQEMRLTVPPGILVLQVSRVRLEATAPAAQVPAGCALRLGGNSGTSYFYIGGRTLQVANENVVVRSPC
jgi:hypothetical protein